MGSLETMDRASGCDCPSAIPAVSRTLVCSSLSIVTRGSSGACSPRSPRANTAIARTCQAGSCSARMIGSCDTRSHTKLSVRRAAARTEGSSSANAPIKASSGACSARLPNAHTAAARTSHAGSCRAATSGSIELVSPCSKARTAATLTALASCLSAATTSSAWFGDKAGLSPNPRRLSTEGRREAGTVACPGLCSCPSSWNEGCSLPACSMILAHSVHLCFQYLAQPARSTMYVRFDCSHGLIEQFGDLSMTEVFKIIERDRHAIAFWKCRHVPLKLISPLVPVRLLVGPQRLVFYVQHWTIFRGIK